MEIFGYLSSFSWLIIIISLIWYFTRRKKVSANPAQNKDYLRLALSKEDAVSQWFLLLSIFFLGVTLLAFNKDLGDPLPWRAILFLTSAVGLIIAYYFKAIFTLIFSLIGLMSWWYIQATEWAQGKDVKTSAILAGLSFIALLFYSLGYFHEKELKSKRFGLAYLILGIIFVTGTLFFLSSKSGLVALGDMTKGIALFGSWQITFSLLVFFISLIGITLYSASKRSIFFSEAIAILFLAALFGVIAFVPEQTMFIEISNISYSSAMNISSNGILWAIIFNLIVFFELLGLIFSGYLRKEEWLINLGAFFLFILIIVKYFDWFFTFLDKSVFFIGAGILLFVVGWLMEKGRRYVIAEIKTEQRSQQ